MNMLKGFVGGLIIAFILVLIGADDTVIQFVRGVLKTNLTTDTYYISFGLLGVLSVFIEKIMK